MKPRKKDILIHVLLTVGLFILVSSISFYMGTIHQTSEFIRVFSNLDVEEINVHINETIMVDRVMERMGIDANYTNNTLKLNQ